ncbi:helix-turn-helix transcriptional regulator [Chitinophagaceae bacterium MMS25-I14]
MGEHATHHGRNVKRLREIMGIKQEALAIELGKEWNQKKISSLESKAQIDEDLLERIAAALKVPTETIKGFDDEMTVYNIQHNYEGANPNANSIAVQNSYCTFNPFDKIVELYERMLQDKDAMIQELKELVKGK